MTTVISGTTGVSRVQDGVVVQADLETAIIPLGVGQTWQNVTASRSNGVTYTNSTGRPIQVSITVSANGNGNGFSVNGAVIGRVDANVGGVVSLPYVFVVPSGATYRASGPAGPTNWSELR